MPIIKRRYFALAAGVAVAGGLALAAPAARASTAQCDAVLPPGTCASYQSEVPGRPDLDVLGASAVSGNSLIVYTRSSTDKAEDFIVVTVNPAAKSRYTVTGTTRTYMAGVTPAPVNSVAIEFAPKGVPSGLCVSTVNPNGHAAAQLRGCSNNSTVFNPFQTFQSALAQGDGTFIKFQEVINNNLMTNPRNSGNIGVPGARVHVVFAAPNGTTGQLWGQNNT